MGIQIQFSSVLGWPPLTWVAQCSNTEMVLLHGSRVELEQDWFAEAVWPGAFAEGGFDQTDLVFGSGGRVYESSVTFVSSGSTLDRLVSIQVGKHVYVSNSLVALCATLNLSVDPLSDEYYRSFRSIQDGLQKYNHLLQTSQGPLRLTYFHNLRWNGRSLDVIEKPFGDRTFGTFEAYRFFLEASLGAIGQNMRDPQRKYPYLPLGTLSTGYDSPTIAVLARAMGNTQVLTFQQGREGLCDSGETIAARLGLSPIALDRTAWRQEPYSEVPFLAADAYGEEMHFVAARSYLQGRVLLTGYHGDKMWDAGAHDLSPHIVRGDPTGLALTEWRLWVGFLHCAVPFFGVRNIEQIHQVSTGDEMKPWSIGGDYDRPICRRIVEEAGVERGLFGQKKNATAVVLWNPKEGFLSEESLQDYARWLRSHVTGWFMIPLNWKINAYSLLWRLPGGWRFSRYPPYFFTLFPWALEHAKRRYMGMGSQF
ncbi:MAG: hypothetical protein A4E19_01665 [Nitrospira sp. SG-bin1]|nr:MAG: hypothetical protein A4E19_01665 [Nitrospira sp. SG-bin1]